MEYNSVDICQKESTVAMFVVIVSSRLIYSKIITLKTVLFFNPMENHVYMKTPNTYLNTN